MTARTGREGENAAVNPFDSLHNLVALTSRDMGATEHDSWVYAIVCGWGDDESQEAWGEQAERWGWDDATVTRLKAMHDAFDVARSALTFTPAECRFCGRTPDMVLGDDCFDGKPHYHLWDMTDSGSSAGRES